MAEAFHIEASSRAEVREEAGREGKVRYRGPCMQVRQEATLPRGPHLLWGSHRIWTRGTDWRTLVGPRVAVPHPSSSQLRLPWRLVPEGAGGALGLEEQGQAFPYLCRFSHPGSHAAVRLPCCV